MFPSEPGLSIHALSRQRGLFSAAVVVNEAGALRGEGLSASTPMQSSPRNRNPNEGRAEPRCEGWPRTAQQCRPVLALI